MVTLTRAPFFHDLADGRLRVGSDLHEVKTLLVGDALGIRHAEQTKLRAVDANQAARTSCDLVIDARTLVLGYLRHLPFVTCDASRIKNSRRDSIQETSADEVGEKSLLSDQTAAMGRRVGGGSRPRF